MSQEAADIEKSSARRIIIATVIGNGFVAYDFTVYSFSAGIIGRLFFPAGSASASLLYSLATFGAGFIMRPLGAMLIGSVADRRGRKAGLTLSLSLMALGTWLIAFLPPYASIGMAATVLIVCARLTQGLAVGGEIGPASAALMEFAGPGRRCYLVSWRGASQGAAAFVAALVGATATASFSPASMQAWGWRIPFALGGLIGPLGWYIRRRMIEAPVEPSHRPALRSIFARHPRTLLYGTLAMAAPSVSIYITVFYMPSYLVTALHKPPAISLLSACLSGLVIFIATPLLARIADRERRRKPIQYLMLTSCLLVTYPAFFLLTRGVGEVASLLIILGYNALALSNAGASTVMMLEAFPRHHRAAGMSMIYSFGVTIFGGFSPLIVAWLIGVTRDPMIPAWYLLAAVSISLFALRRFPGASVD
jgi:MFS transporter, MHS family, proline/betaine transporter